MPLQRRDAKRLAPSVVLPAVFQGVGPRCELRHTRFRAPKALPRAASMPPVAQLRPAFILFGDSITQRGGAVGGWATRLAERYTRRADVVNRGYSGYNTAWATHLLPLVFPQARCTCGVQASCRRAHAVGDCPVRCVLRRWLAATRVPRSRHISSACCGLAAVLTRAFRAASGQRGACAGHRLPWSERRGASGPHGEAATRSARDIRRQPARHRSARGQDVRRGAHQAFASVHHAAAGGRCGAHSRGRGALGRRIRRAA